MFVKIGGGVAYQPDCLSLYDRVPEALRIELYADASASLVLNEGEGIANAFSCKKVGDAFEVTAENNSGVDRAYTIAVYANGKEYSAGFTIRAGETKSAKAE